MSELDFGGSKILVTGGGGFIGSHIVDQLLDAGAGKVVVLDNFERGRRDNLAAAAASGRLDVMEGDICNSELVDGLTRGCDLVFHQAALRITQCADQPRRAIEVMVGGTQNVAEAAVRHGVRKVIAASSASVYGEASYLPMDENHPFNNRTLYGAAKIANEQTLRAYAEMFGLRYVMIRPFNIYGPRMDVFGVYTEVMIRWLERLRDGKQPVIFGDGQQTMDFLYVEDLARAYLMAAASDTTDSVVNGGTGVETSLLELCELLCQAAGQPGIGPVFEPARKVNAVTRRRASTELAEQTIDFKATTGLQEGLAKLVRWHAEVGRQQVAVA